jgi:manganese oxidase
MGGMFTTVKIREGLAKNDYQDPGDYKHPSGTVAHVVEVDTANIQRQQSHQHSHSESEVQMNVRKPMNHSGH